jgi:hypothetical protein
VSGNAASGQRGGHQRGTVDEGEKVGGEPRHSGSSRASGSGSRSRGKGISLPPTLTAAQRATRCAATRDRIRRLAIEVDDSEDAGGGFRKSGLGADDDSDGAMP